eukprot:GGOE01000378.1.p1 GENE.GGOE01000378.1~~GGOE01000378.1.p1  ORF type:complete len:715 (+),score=123.93 GGOE01000378.1:47-2191(+)
MADGTAVPMCGQSAQFAALRAMDAAARAAQAAQAASNHAAHIHMVAKTAVEAQHQTLSSPVKVDHQIISLPAEADQAPPLMDTKRVQDALQQLHLGHTQVEFPPKAIEMDDLPGLTEALRTSNALTHLTLARCIPMVSTAEAVLGVLQGNQYLQFLNLADNHLGEMGEEPNLSTLTQVKRFLDECESLVHVDLSGNHFGAAGTELVCQGVRESVSLRTLDLSRNDILVVPDGEDELLENATNAVREMLTKNKFLSCLILRDNRLTSELVEGFSEALKGTTRLTSLDLAGNDLGSPGSALLANILAEHRGIRSLDLSQNKIGWKGIVSLGDALVSKNRTLRYLSLQRNKFGCSRERPFPTPAAEADDPEEDPEEAEERRKEVQRKAEKEAKAAEKAVLKLAEVLRENPVLTELDLAFNSIGAAHLQHISDALVVNASLTSLNLEMTHLCGADLEDFSDVALQGLGKALAGPCALRTLKLKWNFLQAQGAEILSKSLNVNRNLTALDVGRNFLGDEGLMKLVEGINRHPALTALGVAANGITSRGAAALANWLPQAAQMRALDIQENPLGSEGFTSLAHGIRQSKCEVLLAMRCNIGDCEKVMKNLVDNGLLLRLDLSDNPITFETVVAVVQAAKANRLLQSLRLWSRHPSSSNDGAIAMLAIELLESNPRIRALDLGFSCAPPELMERITAMLWRAGPPFVSPDTLCAFQSGKDV